MVGSGSLAVGRVRRELRGKFKQLARLMGAEQYEQFISSLKKEQQLTHRIKELVQYRKNGITSHEGESAVRQEACVSDCISPHGQTVASLMASNGSIPTWRGKERLPNSLKVCWLVGGELVESVVLSPFQPPPILMSSFPRAWLS